MGTPQCVPHVDHDTLWQLYCAAREWATEHSDSPNWRHVVEAIGDAGRLLRGDGHTAS